MQQAGKKSEIIAQLQQQILSMQGFHAACGDKNLRLGLGPIEDAFPNRTFPTGAVHEFLSPTTEGAAATTGFMAGMLGQLMKEQGPCIWIGRQRTIFPPALKTFGIAPDRIIFLDVANEKDLLWTIEEALKCEALAVVIGEIKEINLTESRRLQLAVEKSRVTGFLHRHNPQKVENIACVSRWQISPLPSALEDGLPGVGYPRWNVTLQKVRNGHPGNWQLQWAAGQFEHVLAPVRAEGKTLISKTG